MKRTLSWAVVILFSASLQAQGVKDKQALPAQKESIGTGRQDIEKLCGCFEVEFKYAETFSPDPAYKFHERDRN